MGIGANTMDETEFQELMRYQAMVSRSVVQEVKTDRKIKVMGIVAQFPLRKKVQIAALLHEAEMEGLSADDVYDIIDDLVKDGILAKQGESAFMRT